MIFILLYLSNLTTCNCKVFIEETYARKIICTSIILCIISTVIAVGPAAHSQYMFMYMYMYTAIITNLNIYARRTF